MYRWDVINKLIQEKGYRSYLEIGYFMGWSFDSVNTDFKTAVDPNPVKTENLKAMTYGSVGYGNGGTIHKKTSDEFFEWKRKFEPERAKENKYDIIFIDGLHECEQVYRDIMNSLIYLSPGGTIVMHDCKPEIYEHTTTGDCGGNWLGDTYKAFIKFRFRYPEYNTYVVDTDWGCGVIETPPDTENTYIDGLYKGEDYRKFLEWEEFEKEKAGLLNLISIEEFKTKMDEETENHNLPA